MKNRRLYLIFTVLLVSLLLLMATGIAMAGPSDKGTAGAGSEQRVSVGTLPESLPDGPTIPTGQALIYESEPNNSAGTANAVGTDFVLYGELTPATDVDWYSFSATAGDRLYAATMTSWSSGGSTDSLIDVYAPNGTSIIETDDDDGTYSGTSSVVAGTVLSTTGTYYVQVRNFSAVSPITPYHLHLRLRSGSAMAESEPNDNIATANPLPGGWASGSIAPTTDADYYSFSLNAGDSIYAALDADPERDAGCDLALGLGTFSGINLFINNAGAGTFPTNPPGEAYYATAKAGGTYYAFVLAGATGATCTYNLNVSIHPKEVQTDCVVYTSTDVPKAIGPGLATVTSVINVPASSTIADVNATLNLTHTTMSDLDVTLTSPAVTTATLFTDIGSTIWITQDAGIDDEAILPYGSSSYLSGKVWQPEQPGRLWAFDGQDPSGIWTLTLADDTANAFGGTLTGWSLEICSVPAGVPSITLDKTVGTDAGVCATTDNIDVDPGTDVTYCYEVTNNGTVSFNSHDLVDSELGNLLTGFFYVLDPGASAFLTETTTINVTTVNTATWTAYNLNEGGQMAMATDTATVNVIISAPEPLVCNGDPVAFELGIPSDWTVVDNTGGTGIVWTTTADDTNCGINNLTGATGEAACADSDIAGTPAVPYDTELVSNPFDLTGGYNVVTLDAAGYYNDLGTGNDLVEVDIWDGSVWTNLLTWDADQMPGAISLDLSAYAGMTGLQVRFVYSGNGYDWYAQVDDVSLTCDTLLDPDIDVDPLTLGTSLYPNEQATQTLTIANVGGANLDWLALEGGAGRSGGPIGQVATGDAIVATTAVAEAGWTPYEGPLDVLYDQTDNAGTNGFPSQDFEPAFDIYDNQGADDFIVPTGEVWTIDTVEVLGSYTAGGGPTPNVDVFIYYDSPGLPGTEVYSALNVVPTSDVAGDLSIPLSSPPVLSEGHYWISVQVNMNFTPLGQWFWSTRAVQSNNPYAWQNPGNGFASGCVAWAYGAGTCGVGGGVDPDALFRLLGTGGGGSACAFFDIPWLSVSPDNGTTGAGGSTPVTIGYDSTGLTPGVYSASVCIESNDPDEPSVYVPVTLTVNPTAGAEPLVCNGTPAAFAAGVPLDWTVIDNAGTGVVWTATGAVGYPTDCGEGDYAGADDGTVCASSDAFGSAEFDTELRSNSFDLTGGFNSITLDYNANYQNFAALDFLDVDISTDGGGSWTNVLSWNEDHGGFRVGPGVPVTIDLSAYAGMTGLMLRWHYYDPNSADFDWYAEIDDVSLTCETLLDPDIEVDPTSDSATLAPDQQVQHILTISNVGASNLDWTISEAATVLLGVTSPAGQTTMASTEGVFAAASANVGQPAAAPSGPLPASPDGPISLVLDDGTAENAIGLTNGGQFIWLNRFTPAPSDYPFTLDQIEVLFRSLDGVNVGETVDLYVYSDADGNPANGATFVGSSTGVTVQALDAFSVYPVSINLSGPGDVLIGVVNRTAGVDAGEFPAAIDDTASQGRSWVGLYGGNPTDPPVIPAPTFGTIDSFGFPGNWMVRGSGTSGGGGGCTPSDLGWLTVAPTNGTTAPGGDTAVTLTYDSTGLSAGVYTGNLCIDSNDPDEPQVVVPITLTVEEGGGDPDIAVAPNSMATKLGLDSQTTLPLTISNEGTADLTWDIEEDDGAARVEGGWSDNFDSYATGSQIHGQGGWKGWFNDPNAGALVSDAFAASAPNSVEILGASDLVHEYSGYTSGAWEYVAWQYIPTGFSGTSYFIMLNSYDDAGANMNWSTQVNFDAGSGLVVNDGASGGTLSLVTDQWVEIRVVIDLDADTQDFYYNGQLLYAGTWTNEVSGGGAVNIAAVDLYANGASAIYYDNVSLAAPLPAPCEAISDIPWLSVSPTAGTTAPAASDVVDVTFDSTGLAVGVYTGFLCVNSNDPDEALVTVPVTLTVNELPELVLTKTVGLDPDTCAATDSIIVPAGFGGTEVTYCYTVENTGDVTFVTHTLTDTVLGTLLNNEPVVLAPGDTYYITQTALITQTTVNTAYWTGYDASGAPTTASDTATVTRADPTDVNVSRFDGVKPMALAPVWLAGLLVLVLGLALALRRRFQS